MGSGPNMVVTLLSPTFYTKCQSVINANTNTFVALDLSAVFSSTSWSTIERYLSKIVHPSASLFFNSRLRVRKARIISNVIKSKEIKITERGTPKGEPSSPIIFNVLVNGFVKAVIETNLKTASKIRIKFEPIIHAQIFANDSAILFSS